MSANSLRTKDIVMNYQSIVEFIEGVKIMGRLLTEDLFPLSFILLGSLGVVLYVAYLEYNFVKEGRRLDA